MKSMGLGRGRPCWGFRITNKTAVIWLGALGLIAEPAAGAEFDYGIGYIGEHHSNMTRTADNNDAGWSQSAIGGLSYRELGPQFAAALSAQGEYRQYRPEYFDSGALYYLDAAGIWTISPRQLTWVVADRYDYGLLDATVPPILPNLTSYNVFETGPDVLLGANSASQVFLGARYGKVRFGSIDGGDTRHRGIARWIYQGGRGATWSLNHITRKVMYDDSDVYGDFRRDDSFVRFDSVESRSHIIIDAGYSRTRRSGGEEVAGAIGSLSLHREINVESRVDIYIIRQYTDSGSAALDSIGDPTAPAAPSRVSMTPNVSGDIYRTRAAEIYYRNTGGLFDVNVGAFGREVDYGTSQSDRREVGGSAEFIHHVTDATALRLFGSKADAQEIDGDQEDSTREYGVGLTYRATRHVLTVAEFRRSERTSSVAELGYRDDVATFSVIYTSSAAYVPAPRR